MRHLPTTNVIPNTGASQVPLVSLLGCQCSLLAKRNRQGILDRHAAFEAQENNTRLPPFLASPLRQVHRPALKCQRMVPSGVVALLDRQSPDAVPGRVGTVNIFPLKGELRTRAWPHIKQEPVETALPLVTHDDATTTVVGVPLVAFPVTAVFSTSPRGIFRRPFTARFSSRFALVNCRHFSPPAATRQNRIGSPCHVSTENSLLGGAIASAPPDGSTVFVMTVKTKDDEPSETLSDEILATLTSSRHGLLPKEDFDRSGPSAVKGRCRVRFYYTPQSSASDLNSTRRNSLL